MAEDKNYALRLPMELFEEVRKAADEDERSINAEIIVLLREALAVRKRHEDNKAVH